MIRKFNVWILTNNYINEFSLFNKTLAILFMLNTLFAVWYLGDLVAGLGALMLQSLQLLVMYLLLEEDMRKMHDELLKEHGL